MGIVKTLKFNKMSKHDFKECIKILDKIVEKSFDNEEPQELFNLVLKIQDVLVTNGVHFPWLLQAVKEIIIHNYADGNIREEGQAYE